MKKHNDDKVVYPDEFAGGSGGGRGGGYNLGERMVKVEVKLENLIENVATKDDLSKLKIWLLVSVIAAIPGTAFTIYIVSRIFTE